MRYEKDDLYLDDSLSKNGYDFIKAFFIWWGGLATIYIVISYFQKKIGIPSVKSENLSFIFAPLELMLFFPTLGILFLLLFASKNEVKVVKNNINFLNKFSEKSIEYKTNDYLFYYLEMISIVSILVSLIAFRKMEAAIMLGYSLGVRGVIANIKGERIVSVLQRYIKNIIYIVKK